MENRKCSIEECEKEYYAKGYCYIHYDRNRKYGSPLIRKDLPNESKCKVDGCNNIFYCKDYCSKHYERFLKYGNAEEPKRKSPRYTGWISKRGYKCMMINGKTWMYHRYLITQHLQRELLPNEDVHHINGDKLDNRIENLEIILHKDHAKLSNPIGKDHHNFKHGKFSKENK